MMKHVVANNLDIDDVLYESRSGPILVRDMIYGYHVEIETTGNDFFAHKTGFGAKSLKKIFVENGFVASAITSVGIDLFGFFFAQLPTEEHCRMLGLRRDVARILAAADLFLLTSVSEGIPLTLLEAMAAALPAVATCVGGVSEVVQDGMTGLLVPAGDDRALATAIQQLACDASLRRRMGSRGQQRAVASFSEQQNHRAYCALYNDMLHD